MRTLVILTFPSAMSAATMNKVGDELKKELPEIEFLLIDQCSSATVVHLPDKESCVSDAASATPEPRDH